MKRETMRPAQVEFIPKELEEGVLYVSSRFSTASHLCCCGCGTKIVTPIHPTEYSLTVRNGLVSLHPSIGNWNHPCQSHYFIRNNQIVWAGNMTPAQIRSGRAFDDAQKDRYFGNGAQPWWTQAKQWVLAWLRK